MNPTVECVYCDNGDEPQLLDEDGVLSSLSGKPGTLCHSYELEWWRCPKHFNEEPRMPEVKE